MINDCGKSKREMIDGTGDVQSAVTDDGKTSGSAGWRAHQQETTDVGAAEAEIVLRTTVAKIANRFPWHHDVGVRARGNGRFRTFAQRRPLLFRKQSGAG
jgi:hypothetical protein